MNARTFFRALCRTCLFAWAGVFASALVPGFLYADPGREQPSAVEEPKSDNPFWPYSSPEIVSQIGLTTDQLALISDKIYETRRKTIDLKAKVGIARLDLQQLLESDTPDEKEAFALVDKIKDLERDVERLRVSLTVAQNRILTKEQRRKLARLSGERRRRGGAPEESREPPVQTSPNALPPKIHAPKDGRK